MEAEKLQAELCKGFRINHTQANCLSVVTPFTYDDGDNVVLFVFALPEGGFRIDDNGEAAFRVTTDGVDLDRGRAQAWLSSLPASHNVHWDGVDDELFTTVAKVEQVASAVMRVAECSAQMQVLSALRVERKPSTFKDEVMEVLREIQAATQIPARYDVPADPNQQIYVDAYFLSKIPVSIVIATSGERLLEAELLWSTAKQLKDPMRVIAVFEDMDKLTSKQIARASYYTDKSVPWRSMPAAFKNLVNEEIKSH